MKEQRLTFLNAAEEVLRRHSPGAPLHFKRITELALEDHLIESKGLTPEATMGAQLYSDVKRRNALGKPERFHQSGKGLFGLATPIDPLGGAVAAHNDDVKTQLRVVLSEADPYAFENLIGTLLGILGFEDVEVTKRSGDGGVDVRATLTVGGVTDVKTAVQVKRWTKNVAGKTVNELRGALGPHERGLVITLSDFTPDARQEAAALDRTPITLVDGDQLLDLLIDNEIGVTSRKVVILELDEEGVFFPESQTTPDSKALAIWPLPGGKLAWKDSLDKILRYIAETAPTVKQAIAWIIENFQKVSSENVARSYLNSVLSLDPPTNDLNR
jgi:restriction system protein